MTTDHEPRALGAALAAPTFVTRGHRVAMQSANRHVERFAPEINTGRVRSMHSLGFVDRLVAPWMETAQRSASLRLFNDYARTGQPDREAQAVSWVFPRPWYQDELDWMTAARVIGAQAAVASPQAAPNLLTTRGTFVPPVVPPARVGAPPVAMPSALYEYVAPSLSLTQPGRQGPGESSREAYSPLISLAAVQAAELMSRAVAPLASRGAAASTAAGSSAVTPGLRSVLSSFLERAAVPRNEQVPTRLAQFAPELVTPPSPRDGSPESSAADELIAAQGRAVAARASAAQLAAAQAAAAQTAASQASAAQVAQQMADQRARLTELSRIAQLSVAREAAVRAEAARAQAAAAQAHPTGSPALAPSAAAIAAASAAPAPGAAAAQATQTAASAELRETAERAEAELRQQAVAARMAEAQRTSEAASADRARLEDQLAQRVAERVTDRTSAQRRLHDQSRAEAAAHARAAVAADLAAPAATTPTAPSAAAIVAPAASAPVGPSAEVAAAIASLPPELAAIVGPAIAARPERAGQVISQLHDALRTVELLAHSSASGATFEATRGPRLVMPAGLGGLISAVDRAHAIGDRSAALAGLGGPRPLAPLPAADQVAAARPGRPAREARVPTLAWLAVAAPAASAAYAAAPATTALSATVAASPAALTHVAWADRWLARFAGATPQSLETISAAAPGSSPARMLALASAAPGSVFVAPETVRGDLGAESAAWVAQTQARGVAAQRGPAQTYADNQAQAYAAAERAQAEARAAAQAQATAPAARAQTIRPTVPDAPAAAPAVPGPRLINQPPSEPILRFDDAAETPDEVFAAISAAAARGRGPAARPAAPGAPAAQTPITVSTTPGAASTAAARASFADAVAHTAPSAPGAGLSAQLASSPFAPALRHVLPLPSAASFDVRALFGAGLGATYLAGLLGASAQQLDIVASIAPLWALSGEPPIGSVAALGQLAGEPVARPVAGFDATYVSPEVDAADAADAPAGAADLVEAVRRTAAQPGSPAAAARAPTIVAAPSAMPAATAAAPGALAAAAEVLTAALATSDRSSGSLTTLRTALLAWNAVQAAQTASTADAPSTSAARTMVEAMSQPMLGEAVAQPSAWSAPGMVAERAHAWSVAQERSTADLAFDFVQPELVLAARVYGLGPAEAAQAARLAVVGPGQLGAMASTVDRTFVESMAIEQEARNLSAERTRSAQARDAAAPTASALDNDPAAVLAARAALAAAYAPAPAAASGATSGTSASAAATGASAAFSAPAVQPSSSSLFGVARRAPRGAFLWPSAAAAALGMTAMGSDGQLSMTVAALELLAAQVVAEIGTYSALSDIAAASRDGTTGAAYPVSSSVSGAALAASPAATTAAFSAPGAAQVSPAAANAPTASLLAARAARRDAAAPTGSPSAEPAEADVLGAATAFVPASRRDRFQALYLALNDSPAGRELSPAARAARALALVGRGEDAAVTARERAASAWDVLPVVYAGASSTGIPGGTADGTDAATGAPSPATAAAAALMANYVSPSMLGGLASGTAGTGPSGSTQARPGIAQRGGVPRDVVAPDGGRGGDHEGNSSVMTGLSARAGNALGAYVTPAAAPSVPGGAVLRAPTAAPEYIQTGASRSGGRYGGGEVEIPSWFEAAARKMLAERSANADGISLAELTLVTAAPASHLAASSVSQPSAAPSAPASAKSNQSTSTQIDIDKVAHDVYRKIMIMMDTARARNGDFH